MEPASCSCALQAARRWPLFSAQAADHPAPKEGEAVIEDFRFHTGDVMPRLNVHYRTIGDPAGEPVLMLHGTAGSGASMLAEGFAGALFGPGQPLDASPPLHHPSRRDRHRQSRPSRRTGCARPSRSTTTTTWSQAQYRLVSEHLGLKHLRLVIGNSMGGMQTWLWGIKYPDFMDALVPLASLPAPMSGRNWMHAADADRFDRQRPGLE